MMLEVFMALIITVCIVMIAQELTKEKWNEANLYACGTVICLAFIVILK